MIPASLQQGLTGFELAAQLNRASSIVRSQLLEPANQAAASQSCTDNGEINLSHVR